MKSIWMCAALFASAAITPLVGLGAPLISPAAAWQARDFGRLMAGHATGDLLDPIDTLEGSLVAGEPAFF
jgi:hypothetical protein